MYILIAHDLFSMQNDPKPIIFFPDVSIFNSSNNHTSGSPCEFIEQKYLSKSILMHPLVHSTSDVFAMYHSRSWDTKMNKTYRSFNPWSVWFSSSCPTWEPHHLRKIRSSVLLIIRLVMLGLWYPQRSKWDVDISV